MKSRTSVLILAVLALTCTQSVAQIAVPILPREPIRESWSVTDREVTITVKDQVASTSITETLLNHGQRAIEVEYLLPIAPGAAVDELTFLADGQEIAGRLLDADEARRVYHDIVRRMRDPALLEYAGYGLIKTSAFPLQANQPVQLSIHYTHVCPKEGDLVEIWYPLTCAQFSARAIEHLEITAIIRSAADISTIYSTSHEVDIRHPEPNHAIVSYEMDNARPGDDFHLFYRADNEQIGGSVLTYWPPGEKDGYYMILVSPSPRTTTEEVAAKDVMIVLDKSGSMSGQKIVQARDAAAFVFDNLNPGDRFNLIAYNDHHESIFETLREANRESIGIARERLDFIHAGGSTNIDAALKEALSQCVAAQQSASLESTELRPSIVLFLTDGLPTAGVRDEGKILARVRKANLVDARIFAFGVGYDVNVRLLDNLVGENSGRSTYVKPEESIEDKVSALYRKIRNPVMTDVAAKIRQYKTFDNTPAELGDLFQGDQIVQVGRMYPESSSSIAGTKTDNHRIQLVVTGTFVGEPREFVFPVELSLKGKSSPYGFLEKLWAVRRIGFLLDEIALRGKTDEVVDEVIRLAKQYGIVTPYTSFLADERTEFAQEDVLRDNVRMQLESEASQAPVGYGAVSGSIARESLKRVVAKSPGFMVDPDAVDEHVRLETVRPIGDACLYYRDEVWKVGDVLDIDPGQDSDQIIEITRFSEEYFSLIDSNTQNENRILAAQKENEKLLIRLRGQVYLIV